VTLLREPSDAQIERFLNDQRSLPFPYPEVGASRDGAPPEYLVNHHQGQLRTGQETFAAVQAIRGWKMYETGWTKLCWPEAPITEGTVVGVLGHHFGVWSLNTCRIAYTIEEAPSLRRYGFAFGTLPIYKLDRLGRSLLVIVDAHDRLQAAGVALKSATEPIDTSTPSGRLIFQLLASFAEYER